MPTREGVSESLCDQVMHSRGDIIDFSAPGVLDVQIAKPFSVACAATKIRLEYHKPFLSKKQRPRRKAQRHLALRASVRPDHREVTNSCPEAQRTK